MKSIKGEKNEKTLSILCVISLFFTLFACVSSESDKLESPIYTGEKLSGTLRICNLGEYISVGIDRETVDIIKLFEEETGIDVIYTTVDNNESMYAKLTSGTVNYDVIITSDYMIERLIAENHLASFDAASLSNYGNIADRFKNLEYDPTNSYSAPYFWGTVGIIYNTKYVTAEEAKSWNVLWDQKYRGKVLMYDNPRDAFAVAQKLLGYSINTTDETEIRASADKLKKGNFIYVADQIFAKIPAENAYLGVCYAGDYLTMLADNEDLAFSIPAEGTNVFTDAMCITAKSSCKELAQFFINYMLDAQIGKINAEYVGYATPNTASMALLDESITSNTAIYPDNVDEMVANKNWERMFHLPTATIRLMSELLTEVRSK